MTTTQVEWSERELLESHPTSEPLIAGGVRCHGGFDDDGRYVSPRTRNRFPAIEAWQAQRAEQFGTELLDIELSAWPPTYPNVAQARHLLRHGVREPIIAILTRIGTVEGFGAMIRYSPIPDMQACFAEDVAGTAISHLGKGLYEAHARDEAGFEDEGGHQQMWFAARDIAFENPLTEDQTEVMLARMGLGAKPGETKVADVGAIRKQALGLRAFDDVDFDLELLIARMASLLLIEISAFHTFAWAEEVLSDTDLVAGDGEAARLVSYIRTDEAPHVAYLKTALSEMRDRSFVRQGGGGTRPGTEVVGTLWEQAKEASFSARQEQVRNLTLGEIEHALAGRADRDDILEELHALGDWRPRPGGGWDRVS